ncbi:MAG: hypothetical protein ACOYLF_04545 [Blastocatellia bacterium]|jgi:hypothetical protein
MNKSRIQQIVTITVSMVLGGVVGWVGISLAARVAFISRMLDQIAQLPAPLVLLLLLPTMLLVIFVHELGHLAGGLSRGMRFLLLVVGPFQWTRSTMGVSFNWNLKPALMGGLAAAIPDRQRPLRPQLLRLVVGGPLASLLLGAGSITLAGQPVGLLTPVLLMAGLLSLVIFLATAIPFRAGGMQSDGWQLIELLRGGKSVIERQLILELVGSSLAGQRPRDWDQETIGQLEQLDSRDPLRRIAASLQVVYHYWDRGEYERVEPLMDWIDKHLEYYPDGFRQAVHLELALLALDSNAGSTGHSRVAAERHMTAAAGGIVDPARRQLLAAAFALREGRFDEAQLAIIEARRVLPRGMDPGINLFTADQLDRLEGDIERSVKR